MTLCGTRLHLPGSWRGCWAQSLCCPRCVSAPLKWIVKSRAKHYFYAQEVVEISAEVRDQATEQLLLSGRGTCLDTYKL